MHCPRCQSHDVERKPGNQVSHDQGYRCHGCQSNLRSPESIWMLLAILLLGLAFGIGLTTLHFTTRMDWEHRPIKVLWYSFTGYAVAIYAISQLCRPVVRTDDDD